MVLFLSRIIYRNNYSPTHEVTCGHSFKNTQEVSLDCGFVSSSSHTLLPKGEICSPPFPLPAAHSWLCSPTSHTPPARILPAPFQGRIQRGHLAGRLLCWSDGCQHPQKIVGGNVEPGGGRGGGGEEAGSPILAGPSCRIGWSCLEKMHPKSSLFPEFWFRSSVGMLYTKGWFSSVFQTIKAAKCKRKLAGRQVLADHMLKFPFSCPK